MACLLDIIESVFLRKALDDAQFHKSDIRRAVEDLVTDQVNEKCWLYANEKDINKLRWNVYVSLEI